MWFLKHLPLIFKIAKLIAQITPTRRDDEILQKIEDALNLQEKNRGVSIGLNKNVNR